MRGFDVAYLGVRIGRIDDVALAPGKIVVALSIDREVRIPRGVTAEVRRKSAIGEPYVEISPPKAGVGGEVMPPGATIPLSSTSVPLDYRRLFEGVGKLLNAVPPQDAQTIVNELAAGLDGRTTSIREIVDNTHDLTTTLAENTRLLDDLSVNLTRLTGTLAGKREELASGVTDLAGVTRSIRDSRRQLHAFLDHGPGFFRQVDRLLNVARPGLSCTLMAAGMRQGVVFTARNQAHISHLLRTVPTTQALLADTTERHAGGLYGRVTFIFSVPGGPKVAEEYRGPLAPPATPKLRSCPKGAPVPDDRRTDEDEDTGPHPDGSDITDDVSDESSASPEESEGPLEAEGPETGEPQGRAEAGDADVSAGSAQDYTPSSSRSSLPSSSPAACSAGSSSAEPPAAVNRSSR
nr:hypothetical protein GCM10020093_117020 [Planobispora longispora]